MRDVFDIALFFLSAFVYIGFVSKFEYGIDLFWFVPENDPGLISSIITAGMSEGEYLGALAALTFMMFWATRNGFHAGMNIFDTIFQKVDLDNQEPT